MGPIHAKHAKHATHAIKRVKAALIKRSILLALLVLMLLQTACGAKPDTTGIETTTEVPITATKPIDITTEKNTIFPFFESKAGDIRWGLMSAEGNVVVEPLYQSLDRGQYEGYFTGYLDESVTVFDASGKAVLNASLNAFYEEEIQFYRSLQFPLPFFDESTQRYGYRQGEKVLLEPSYVNAMPLKDGYALVQSGSDETLSSIIDIEGNVILADPKVQLVNLGRGYFGAIEDIYSYQTEYFKKRIVGAYGESAGKTYPAGEYYTILPLINDSFFVYDGQYGRFIDAGGDKISGTPEIFDYNGFDLVGNLVRAQALTLDFISVAYYSEDGKLIWSNKSEFTSYNQSEQLIVTPEKPHISLFKTFMPVSVRLPNYPEAEKAINQITARIPDESIGEDDEAMTQSLSYQVMQYGNFITVQTDYYSYGIGAAHPNSAIGYAHYDLQANQWMQLEDFFENQDKGLQAIGDYIVEQMGNEGTLQDYWIEDGLLINPGHAFYIDKEGFSIVFQQYEIAPYAAGMPRFTVPYSVLKPYLKVSLPSVAALLIK